jgi:hypothetical protein
MSQNSASIFDRYEWAIVRLATCRAISEKSRPSLLVFASLEFVHSGRPRPDSTPLNSDELPPYLRSPGSYGLVAYFRRVAMNATEALRWYRSAADGILTIPVPDDPSERGRFDGTPLRSPILVDEPTWPQLAFPISDQSVFGSGDVTYPTPFLGPGALPARIHRLMSAADPDLEALARDPHLCAWLASRIHFRVEDYIELLGSIVLVAPDPQVAKVSQYFTRDAARKERLVTQVHAHAGQPLQNLTLTVFEERFGAISTFEQLPVPPDGNLVTEPPGEVRASGYMLAHPERGLIDFRPPAPFIRTIGLSMETYSRTVRLQTRDGKKKGAEVKTHDIGELTAISDSLVGDTVQPLDAHTRFWQAVGLRQTGSQARKSDQMWINDPESARSFLRRLIGSAREEVFVADCFFNAEDLASYLHFVHRLNIRIRVLTSRAILGSGQGRDIALRRMQESVSSFHNRGIVDIQVRLMRNHDGEPILHDRFLAVDGAVWFSGNSLNAIGQRESMIIKLPDAKSVMSRLNAIFDHESDDFAHPTD